VHRGRFAVLICNGRRRELAAAEAGGHIETPVAVVMGRITAAAIRAARYHEGAGGSTTPLIEDGPGCAARWHFRVQVQYQAQSCDQTGAENELVRCSYDAAPMLSIHSGAFRLALVSPASAAGGDGGGPGRGLTRHGSYSNGASDLADHRARILDLQFEWALREGLSR